MENENSKDKRGLFLGIIGVLTLIVAIIGASFAYFSLNARSAENAVNVSAATVQLVYKDGDNIAIENIIPSTQAVALETIRRAGTAKTEGEGNYTPCIDDNNYRVCGTYDFSVTNNGTNAVDINAYVKPTALEEGKTPFNNLKFITFDRTNVTDENNNGTILDGANGLSVTYSDFGILGADKTTTISVPAGESKTFRLFIWLDEKGEENNAEQGASFVGTIYVDVAGASGNLTGTASTAE